ncbi:DUF6177 family protein [Streptomyces sp. 142MFCol3.1]|uniref:DUF6177 family protein n=1 Tax=Streptomyces sp. 142MFCol3.1 TaxID=1172179 RepID=UPI00040EA90D|nr:DUF6177 family protein [Streptomyces sp. 142MFCol3.1]
MTKDVIALTPKMPDTWALLAGLYAGGPGLDVSATADGAVIQLCGHGGRPLVSVEAPVLVQVPGEARRLLGIDVPVPFWWTEARASTAVPEAARLAGSVCGRLNALLGGTTWPSATATTEVVDTDAVAASGADQPAVDVLTDSTAVVLIDRPVVALTSWLSEVLRTTSAAGRALQIVTPPHVRLSCPARTTLAQVPNRWVVQDPACGYYDGLSGAALRWQDGTFTPDLTGDGRATVADAFTSVTPSSERQLIIAFRTLHPADEQLMLGRALEAAWQSLTGTAPAGWGTAEPVNLPWRPRQLTDLARSRVPGPTQLIAIGHPDRPSFATLRVTRTTTGVEEDVHLTLGYSKDETAPLDAIKPLAEALVTDHHLTTMLTSLRQARRDLTTPPHLEAPPIPHSFTLGPKDVRDIGLTHARRPPLDLRPTQLGPAAQPALHYPLGDGAGADHAWTTLRRLAQHLKQA